MATVRCEEIANEKCGSFLANEVGCPFSLKILRIHRLVLCVITMGLNTEFVNVSKYLIGLSSFLDSLLGMASSGRGCAFSSSDWIWTQNQFDS